MCVHLSQWNIMEIEEEKHIGAPMLLTIALVDTMLIPKKEDLQGAGLSDTKCPCRTIMVNEWTLVMLPVQSRVFSRKSHKLPRTRTHEKISPTQWRSALWAASSPGWGLLASPWLKISGKRATIKPLPHLYYWQIQLPTLSESFEILDLGTGMVGRGCYCKASFFRLHKSGNTAS